MSDGFEAVTATVQACAECGAVVPVDLQERHLAWHEGLQHR